MFWIPDSLDVSNKAGKMYCSCAARLPIRATPAIAADASTAEGEPLQALFRPMTEKVLDRKIES
jgi:hypothetical protein